jgi:hypothetical protein
MAHQHELSILKALADAVVHRKFGANFIKFKAHGNEVADRITNLAANTLFDVETDGRGITSLHRHRIDLPTRDRTRVPMVSGVTVWRTRTPRGRTLAPSNLQLSRNSLSPGGHLMRVHPPDRQGTHSCQTFKGTRSTPG